MKTLKFNELNLSNEIIRAIKDIGFEEATPIQSASIPRMMTGVDIVGQAQTGTGKTAAFGIPVLERINPKNKNVQSIILCPSRELAIQVAEELKLFSKYKKGIYIVPIYGGQPIQRQITSLSRGAQIVIGTPGRVIDHLNRKTLKLNTVLVVVLDEADEMLDMGFRDDIELILKSTPEKKQTVFFSATMPKDFLLLTKKYQKQPEIIKIINEKLTVPSIEQYYFDIREHQKLETLVKCIDMYNPKLSLVFCNTKKRVDEIASALQIRGYSADAIHGDMSQSQRDRVMSKFRHGNTEILIATDLAARGIDVENIDMVFNFDIPKNDENYVHRIGRTGRAGKQGKAYNFVSGKDIYKLRDIQKYTKSIIKRKNVPSSTDVENTKITATLDKIKDVLGHKNFEKYTRMIEPLISNNTTSLDVAAALLKMMLTLEKKDQKLNMPIKIDDNDSKKKIIKNKMEQLFVNIGKNDSIKIIDIVDMIKDKAGSYSKFVGNIKIFDSFSFVDVPQKYSNDIINALQSTIIKGKKIFIALANKKNK